MSLRRMLHWAPISNMSPVGDTVGSQEVTRVAPLTNSAAQTPTHWVSHSNAVTLTGQYELLFCQFGPCGWQEVELQQN